MHARLLAWGKRMLRSNFRLKSARSLHKLAVFCDDQPLERGPRWHSVMGPRAAKNQQAESRLIAALHSASAPPARQVRSGTPPPTYFFVLRRRCGFGSVRSWSSSPISMKEA